MSDTTDEFPGDLEADSAADKWRKKLEKQAAEATQRATEAEARAQSLERENVFTKVKGLDAENPAHKFFIENYKGDLTQDAITAKATELQFLTPEAPAVPDAELHQLTQMDRASLNAPATAPAGTADAKEAAILNASTREEFLAATQGAGYLAQG